jgi:hypothetical protein
MHLRRVAPDACRTNVAPKSGNARRSVVLRAWVATALLLAGCAAAPPSQTAVANVDRLLATLAARLELTARLADERWNARLGGDEPMRERESIDVAVSHSFAHSLAPEVVRDVYQGQLDAARIVQDTLRAEWNAERRIPSAAAGGTGAAIWRELERTTPQLLDALARAYPHLRGDGGRELLEQRARTAFASIPGGTRAATAAVAPIWQLAQ